MSKKITIYTDYVCPYCLLAEHVIEGVIKKDDVEICWRPFELRPAPMPTLRVEDPYLPNIWKQSVYPMAEQLGVPIKLPTISPQPRTSNAFEVLAFAEEKGLGHAFSMSVLKAFFQENLDIGDPEILARLGAGLGLKHKDVLVVLEKGTYREQHKEAIRHANEDMEISSVPTIVIGSKILRGVPKPEELRLALNSA
ncbi:MAG: DsbA family protein [Thalassolituus sp.]|jgi:predicted DsbA family dithiol-disulfide isomerase